MGKWIIAIVVMILIWTFGGVIFSLSLSATSLESYSGLFSLTIGIIVLILMVKKNSFENDETGRIQNEIDKRKKQIENHEKAIKYYESQLKD